MPKSVYFPQNIFKSNTSFVYSPYCLRFSMPPGEGAAKIGTSLSIRNGIFQHSKRIFQRIFERVSGPSIICLWKGVSRYWGKSANQDMSFSCDLSTKITALTSKFFVLYLIVIERFSILNVLIFKIYKFAYGSSFQFQNNFVFVVDEHCLQLTL